MSNQEQEISETTVPSDTSPSQPTEENETLNKDEKSLSSSNDSTTNTDQEKPRRVVISQDIRYATEHDDREVLMEKYNHYQVSDSNACHLRFLTDHRQKKYLLGRNEDDQGNLQILVKTFDVNFQPGYQNTMKQSFKLRGTEANVQKCLIETMNRMFNQIDRPTNQDEKEKSVSSSTEESSKNKQEGEQTSSQSASVIETPIDPDPNVSQEKVSTTPLTPVTSEEKRDQTDEKNVKFIPLERKAEYTFTILITAQGQEVLKKNWNFFAGPLQQRLNVVVTNPFKLSKFGDKQWQNELSITGERIENIADAVLQITAFINDVLGIPIQPYYVDEETAGGDQSPYRRTKNNYNSDYSQSRRYEYNNSYRQSPSQHQGQASPHNSYHDRTFFNRGRQGVYEQVILIRNNCVSRIVGTRGSTLRRIQGKCHLRDIAIGRPASENGYVECTMSAYQARNLGFAIDTIRSYLRNEDDQAVQVLESHFVDTPSQASPYQYSPHPDQPQLAVPNKNHDQAQQQSFPTNRYQQQQQMSFSEPQESRHRETGFITRPAQFGNGSQMAHSSYNFQNTPSFDFTHRPTSASRKTDKRPGEVTDCVSSTTGQTRILNDCQYQQYAGSSSSNSSSVSPRHKSKRACPETKEIDCTTDEGFWIQKQYYHALDDPSKELFDSLLEKLEKIRIASEENALRKQQRLVGRNRSNKIRGFNSSMPTTSQLNEETIPQIHEKDLSIKTLADEQEAKLERTSNEEERFEEKKSNFAEEENKIVAVE